MLTGPPPKFHGTRDILTRILRGEIERTMALLGVSHVAELEPKHVTQLVRLGPIAGTSD